MRNKRERFVALANARVTKAIKSMKLVGNLSSKSSYEYTADDARKIIRAIQREIDILRGRFSKGGSGDDTEFRL